MEGQCRPEPKYPLPPIRVLCLERNAGQHYKAAIDQNAEVNPTSALSR